MVRDPIRYQAGTNLYAYCGNNPLNATDPWGLKPELVVIMVRPNGERHTPASRVKHIGQEGTTRRKIGQQIPIFAPPLPPDIKKNILDENDLQGFVDQFKTDAWQENQAAFAAFWRPKGPHDYKYKNTKYDAFGNFMYGATGRAAGFEGEYLQYIADDILKFGNNAPQNIKDIQAGINWYDSRAKFKIEEISW